MKSPDRAIRLMQRIGVYDALIGDVAEQHRAGRTAIWLWRQTLVAIAARLACAVRNDPTVVGVAAVTAAVDVALPYVWTRFLARYAIVLHVAWYPRAISWLALSSPHVLWQVAVFLHPWEWDFEVGWCALLAVMAWCLVGIWPRRANLIVVVFVLSNICETLPYLQQSFLDWLHEPFNPVWASNFVWFGLFSLVAIPASIYTGGHWYGREVEGDST